MQCCTAKGVHFAESNPFYQSEWRRDARGKDKIGIFFLQLAEIRSRRHVYILMKLHTTPTQHYQTVTGYDASGVEINAIRFNYSLTVMPETPPVAWPAQSFDSLTAEHFETIAAASPDVVILGTGSRQRFIHPRLVQALTSRRIGVECMDNPAACRTYNILMGEGRKVVLALIME